ncbi:MAG: alkaline phosphatase family protein [Thaumarchaeota archaeon]|nr:alkaline phosphatase family protein [Nitrososphaerota archaeon]
MKIGYVLLDGCADRPNPKLNFTTPLEAAFTPNLDEIASRSRLGRVVTVRRGVAPESDIAVFNMLGYSFDQGYPGRGVVEAVGAGVDLERGDLALRANFASVVGRRIVDRRAGRNLTEAEALRLSEDLKTIKLRDAEFEFRPTISYRGVLVIRSRGGLSAGITNTDPAYAKVGGFGAARPTKTNERVLECRPESDDPAARLAARLVNEFTAKSLVVLASSDVNRERKREGKVPANAILLRDAGDHVPQVEPFETKYGMKGTAVVEMPAEVGIARILRMKMVEVADRKDIREKASLFTRELHEGTVVYVHIKGPDEFGHDGDAVGKKKSIEEIDRGFFSTVKDDGSDIRLGVSCDHATPCTMMMHSSDPVPLLITGGQKRDAKRFTERGARRGSLGLLQGRDVLARVAEGPFRRRTS